MTSKSLVHAKDDVGVAIVGTKEWKKVESVSITILNTALTGGL